MPDRQPVSGRGTKLDLDQSKENFRSLLGAINDPLGVAQPEINPAALPPLDLDKLLGQVFDAGPIKGLRLTSADPAAGTALFHEANPRGNPRGGSFPSPPYEAGIDDVRKLLGTGGMQPEANVLTEGKSIEQMVRKLLKLIR
jgi:hypothetical protein